VNWNGGPSGAGWTSRRRITGPESWAGDAGSSPGNRPHF